MTIKFQVAGHSIKLKLTIYTCLKVMNTSQPAKTAMTLK